MHKNTLWFVVAILCIYFSLVLCEESNESQDLVAQDSQDILKSDLTDLTEEGRTRRHRHHLYSRWGWHALAIAYLVKVKIVVVAFFVGSAVWFGLRYLWPTKCHNDISGIVLDHPPPSFAHHDHIPYSLDHDHSDHYSDHHHFDSSSFGNSGPSSFEPYSAYSGHSFDASDTSAYSGPTYDASDAPPSATSPESHTFRKKRDITGEEDVAEDVAEDESEDEIEQVEERARQVAVTEAQIGNFMFSFLGLDSVACRRRFICEMEFRSKVNPLTAMAFRVVGRSFFGKYTNDKNENGRAGSFEECAAVNSECVFIESENLEEPQEEETTEQAADEGENVEEAEEVPATDDDTQENSLESNNIVEKENISNIKAELRNNSFRKRVRGDRYLKNE